MVSPKETVTAIMMLMLFENTLAQTESLLHIQEQTVRSIGLYMKSEFTWDGVISLNHKPLKLLHLSNNINIKHG